MNEIMNEAYRLDAILDAARNGIRLGMFDLDEATAWVIEAIETDPTLKQSSLLQTYQDVLTGKFKGGDSIPARLAVKKIKQIAAEGAVATNNNNDDGAA
jgi:hypothetical protein